MRSYAMIVMLGALLLFHVTDSFSADTGMLGPPTRSELAQMSMLLPQDDSSVQKIGLIECMSVIWQENDYMFDSVNFQFSRVANGTDEKFYTVTGIRDLPNATRVSNYRVSFNQGTCDVEVKQVTYSSKTCKEVKETGEERYTILGLKFGPKWDLDSTEEESWADPTSGRLYCVKERKYITNVKPLDDRPPKIASGKEVLFDTNPDKYLTIDGRLENKVLSYK